MKLTLVLLILFSLQVRAEGIQAQISNLGDTTHVEFSGADQWDYDVQKIEKNKKTFVQLTVAKLSDSMLKQLKSFSSPLVLKVQVDHNGPDGKDILLFEMAQKDIDSFDYLTDQPSRLIIDFFAAKKETKQASAKAKSATSEKKKETKIETPVIEERKPATADVLVVNPSGLPDLSVVPDLNSEKKAGIFDGADPQFERFSIKPYEIKEESIIASKENVYLDFPMLRMPSPHLENIQSRQPIYEIEAKNTEENKQARLLLILFQNKKYNLFIKTLGWFLEKFPESEYDEIVRYMWADALYSMWQENGNMNEFDLAMLRYRQVLEKYPKSALAERTQMLMGFATLDRGDYLGTLRLFQSHIKNRPPSANRDIARLAVAEALLKLNKYEEATAQYNEIEKDAFSEKYKKEATYLKGDVHFQKKDYASSIRDYQEALKKYPEAATEFPNALYNQAASYFGLNEYVKSLDVYREFLKKFPAHSYAAYAMTRVGELLDILGADKQRVTGAYLETYFRYGETPGSVVAKLKLLSSRMNAMKPKEVEKSVKDIEQLSAKSDLPNIAQFSKIMVADGYARRGEFAKSVDLLVKYYQGNPTTADTTLLTTRIVKYINEDLRDLVKKGDFINALKLHNKYAESWLKSSSRIDTKYNVGHAFELAGVFSEAEVLYKDTLNKLYALKGTQAEKERNIFEKLPNSDEINLRLASVSAMEGKFSQAYDYLRDVKAPEKLGELEQIERVQLAASLLDKKGDSETAIRYLVELIKTWKGLPELVADPYLHLAQLELKLDRTEDAEKSLGQVITLMEDSKKVKADTHSKSLELLAQIQLKKNQVEKAQKTYQALLDTYEKSKPLASIRYKLGQLYFEKGEVQKAAEVWGELKSEKTEFWYKLAQEQLKGSEWNGDYKKYIKRIPAMSERK